MFEKIYGHDMQKEVLENSIKNDKISHAYLFYGPDGIGKKQIALEFAKNILDVENLETCVDYKYIEKLEDKKEILVQQVRENITQNVVERPIASKKKVYIVNDANLLNDVGQNALLKTLEEPPSYIVIILIASNTSSFLSTILSRVSKLKFNSLKQSEIINYVKENGFKFSQNIINFSQGSIGKLHYILDNNLQNDFEKIDELLENIKLKKISKVMDIAKDVDFNNIIYLEYLEFVLYDNKMYSSCLEIKTAIARLKMNGNYDIVIDNMLLRCIESI